MLELIKSLFSNKAKDSIVKTYFNYGLLYGDVLSYMIPIGKCCNFDTLQEDFLKSQKRYMEAGYKPIAISNFIEAGGFGKNIGNLLRKRYTKEDKKITIEDAENLVKTISNDLYQNHLKTFKGSNLASIAMSTDKMVIVNEAEDGNGNGNENKLKEKK